VLAADVRRLKRIFPDKGRAGCPQPAAARCGDHALPRLSETSYGMQSIFRVFPAIWQSQMFLWGLKTVSHPCHAFRLLFALSSWRLFENPPGEGTGPTRMVKLGDFL